MFRDPNKLTAPELPHTPLFACGLATWAAGHQPGDEVRLYSSVNGTRFTIPSAFGSVDFMPAGQPQGFQAGETIDVEYSTCEGQVSPRSPTAIVALYPDPQLPAVALVGASLVPGVTRFAVTGAENGARLVVSLTRSGSTETWDSACGASHCIVYVPSVLGRLEPTDSIEVAQVLCRGSESPPVGEEVKACGDSPVAVLSPAPRVGDSSVHLSEYPLGGTVRVYVTKNANANVDLELVGVAHDTATVALTRPISTDDRWVLVAVDTPTCTAQMASGWFVGQ